MNIKFKQIPLKIVVRRLAPTLPQSIFESSLPHETLNQVEYFEYIPGKIKSNGDLVYSRAYLYFKSSIEAEKFIKSFSGHIYKDKSGILF